MCKGGPALAIPVGPKRKEPNQPQITNKYQPRKERGPREDQMQHEYRREQQLPSELAW
jgi:hypothetical protein